MTTTARRLAVPLAVLLATLVAGCNGTIGALEPAFQVADAAPEKTEGRKLIGKPYKVGGRWYHPKDDENYDKSGLASWYGPKFHGRRTANGERFDQNALTAAHPTLPLPSYVRVTVKRTGKSAVLRVNDRGPFTRGRIIDVSKGAAEELGFKNAGHSKVRVEYLGAAPVGGSNEDTLLAAKEFGDRPSASPSLRDFLPFGKTDDDGREKDVEVHLAANKSDESTGGGDLPGVSQRYAARRVKEPAEPITATAYADAPATNGAIDAVIALNAPEEEEDAKIVAQPLPETAREAGAERVMGAHDMFAAAGAGGISRAKIDEPAAAQ